ncbi:MAG: Regulatory protein AtoC [Candidatus Moanabacter tarae]|uniref:Regulatory protein AtoC n=1 Tax=Candidatus Moanibacter tarae TaxID=2200854 RepID=A0A2Z4AGV0_9BACT|nr:MAG: Regulatory protein AtoC [Candidatus Moanabacter tarae]|tara:strand:+ start:29222 stop:30583 length:1362 start_codon:yes stop_codon:yes gene_type:complete
MPATILIVDDEKHTREGLKQVLGDNYEVYLAESAVEAFNLFDSENFDVVLTDLKMAGQSGLNVIDRAIELSYRPIVIMMTAYGTVESAVEAMRRGACDFLTKPVNLEQLEIVIKRALKSRNLEVENQNLHERLDSKFNYEGIIGNSLALSEVMEKMKLVARSKATVLLHGETGTGKELFAQAIHQNSDQARNSFIAVHCASLPSNLLESELFGHEKGAFTGADERRIGRFEAADGGTLFIDEIGEVDASTQVKLLRFLELRTFERLGSIKPIKVDVRLVVATNQKLEELVRSGRFREDLYYRLNVIPIELPPLRDRKEDIPILLMHYLQHFAKENQTERVEIEPSAMKIIQEFPWPGNVRELRNMAEHIVVLKGGGRISEYDLPPHLLMESMTGRIEDTSHESLLVEENEKRLVQNSLVKAKGNRTRAAELMGISRRTLHRKLKQWPDLNPEA